MQDFANSTERKEIMPMDLTFSAFPLFLAMSGLASAEGLAPKQKIEMARELLKSLETKDPKPFRYINPRKYIQHNLQIGDGPEGVKQLISQLPANTKVNTVRIFADGDFLVAHSEYEFFGPKVGFDVFRFEDGEVVQHWG